MAVQLEGSMGSAGSNVTQTGNTVLLLPSFGGHSTVL
jgi:hypothetical protein